MSEGIELLKGHVSFETAYIIPSYPYSSRLRCKRAVWVEAHPRFGQRFVSRTTNPKKPGEVWNTPHADTYNLAVVLYRDPSDGHIKETHLHNVWDIERTRDFLAHYGAALDDETREEIKRRLCDLVRKESQDRSFTSTGYVPGTQVIQERVHEFPATISQEEAARLLAEYAPAPQREPERAPLGPLFGGQ